MKKQLEELDEFLNLSPYNMTARDWCENLREKLQAWLYAEFIHPELIEEDEKKEKDQNIP